MKFGLFVAGIVLGGGITYLGLNSIGQSEPSNSTTENKNIEKKPLYWVAPMDANYKRDKPGKSPMGMDLIPFYGNQGSGPDEGEGTIKISPSVVNNLGVRTDLVKKQSLHSQINTVGYINYDEDYLIHIHPRVNGWIEKLYVKASGDPIKKGEPLYEIYSPEMVNAQEELLLALERKNQRLIKAAKNRLVSLQVPILAIKELERTRKVKQSITFYSPSTGVIDNLKIREGFYVKPGITLMSIGTLKQVWVNAEIFERQASEVEIGIPVEMKLDYLPGQEWKGVVDYIYPTLDVKTRTIKVRLKFANEDELLKPGMFAQVIIHGKKDKPTLSVPKEAVIRTGNSNRVVLALGEGSFKSINVKVGKFDDQYAQILEGLNEGERIVTSAQFLLDSESSKTSDFKRMSKLKNKDDNSSSGMKSMDKNSEQKEWAEAKVVKLMPEDTSIKVTHSEIPNWKWPSMTMNFEVSDRIDFSMFKVDMPMDIEITKTKDNKYIITDVRMKH
ncbi:efflux RND transporter periplasmic adaptor subunit [Arcobacter sp. KX21116]|jgi:Cu(I)/Ag(I) efflux system membrane fusion protein|uniref:efflux RND transporter periplasmic adaptor subunit n=1 Tax=Arcobacter iocasae TaxID=2906515 RepID=UPI0035D4C199|tara:strand:+ start:4592 stop:6094 length:1503 start_codon:yes stop_codon:yes gene_type:complete